MSVERAEESALPPSALAEADSPDDRYEIDPANIRPIWCRVLILSLLEYWFAPTASVRWREARDWIFHPHPQAANSFDSVCLLLGMQAKLLRAQIATRRAEFAADPAQAGNVRVLLTRGVPPPAPSGSAVEESDT